MGVGDIMSGWAIFTGEFDYFLGDIFLNIDILPVLSDYTCNRLSCYGMFQKCSMLVLNVYNLNLCKKIISYTTFAKR